LHYVKILQQKHKELQTMEAKVDEMRGKISFCMT